MQLDRQQEFGRCDIDRRYVIMHQHVSRCVS